MTQFTSPHFTGNGEGGDLNQSQFFQTEMIVSRDSFTALTGPFVHDGGYSWSTIVDTQFIERCRRERESQKQEFIGVRFFENAIQIGICSFTRAAVRQFGYGLFFLDLSVTPAILYFSTADNSDPNHGLGIFSLEIIDAAMPVQNELVPPLSAREFDQHLVPIALRYLEQSGAKDSFYTKRLANDHIILANYEYDFAAYLLSVFSPESTAIVEVGIGFGQLLLYLVNRGFSAIGVDRDWGRLRGAAALRAACSETHPAMGARYHLVNGDFPADRLPIYSGKRNLVLFTNLGIGASEDYCDQAVAGLEPADFVLLDVQRFFRDRDEAEQAALQRKIEDRYGGPGTQIRKTHHYNLMVFPLG